MSHVFSVGQLQDLTLYVKDNYQSNKTTCIYRVPIYGPGSGGMILYGQRVYSKDYNNDADSSLYIFKNGTLINGNNFDLNEGSTFNIYVKPHDVIAIKHVYKGDGVVVTQTSLKIESSLAETYASQNKGSYGYLKVSGDSTYAISGFGQGRANASTIQFTTTKRT